MPEPQPIPPATPVRSADWEAFYRDYRKPGYVSGFEITTKLGGGMFGLVFRARKQSIGKDYAIKFLLVDDTEVRRAVLAELEAVKLFAQIDHPNLVSIEDRGEVDGIPFLVMSFAGTQTLKDRIPTDGKPPSPADHDDLLRFFLQACRGIAALHERSLVHFDIKPANIFLKGAVARVGDYGLSKLITHSRGSLSMGRGTPYYMAPEMLQRRGDHRSDIYSLGIVLYELLCGSVPFRGDSEWEVLRKHETEAPTLPTHLSASERAVLQRCLQKDPAARFQSVHEVIAGLGAPTSAAAAALRDGPLGSGPVPPVAPRSPEPKDPSKVPPPLPPDPYVGFRRASREALGHAQKIAREALGSAREVAQKATQQAQHAMREQARRVRDGEPSWFTGFRRRSRRDLAPDAPDTTVVAPRRRRRMGFLGVAACFLLFGLLLTTLRTARGGQTVVFSSDAAGVSETPLLRVTSIPSRYTGMVTVGVPGWAITAERDLSAAQHELNAHLLRLRDMAPLAAKARAKADELPSFKALVNSDDPQVAILRGHLTNLAEARGDLHEEQMRLRESDRVAVLLAAEMLTKVEVRDQEQLGKARRLHEFLAETTGCDSIPLFDGPELEGKQLREANRDLGLLWLWYVNEVANTTKTWDAYRNVRFR